MIGRLTLITGLVLAIGCLASPIALAQGGPPLQASRYDGRSPDTKDAAQAAHRNGRTVSAIETSTAWAPLDGVGFDGRSPDTKDAAASAQGRTLLGRHSGSSSPKLFDGRSPDTKDAAAAAQASRAVTVVVSASGGFDWTDAGIGAAAGFGLASMLGAGLALARGRHGVVVSS